MLIGTDADFPSPFSDVIYRRFNSDLKHLSDFELHKHFLNFGKGEGRRSGEISCADDFVELIRKFAKPTEVLEISPFTRPRIQGSFTSDVMTREQLVVRAIELGLEVESIPEVNFRIDPVAGKSLSSISLKFSAILSSHVIEHQPDVVTHLEEISTLLLPRGRYFLIVPDHRYCFDALLESSNLAEVVTAREERRRIHTLASVIEHRALTTHNDPTGHWKGLSGEIADAVPRFQAAIEEFRSSRGGYLDVHAWQFTPDSFEAIVEVVVELYKIPLQVERVYHTLRNQLEFFVILKRL